MKKLLSPGRWRAGQVGRGRDKAEGGATSPDLQVLSCCWMAGAAGLRGKQELPRQASRVPACLGLDLCLLHILLGATLEEQRFVDGVEAGALGPAPASWVAAVVCLEGGRHVVVVVEVEVVMMVDVDVKQLRIQRVLMVMM